jgi:hypothetical protein
MRFQNPCADTLQMKGVGAAQGSQTSLARNGFLADWAFRHSLAKTGRS